jgi:hypothetical protein
VWSVRRPWSPGGAAHSRAFAAPAEPATKSQCGYGRPRRSRVGWQSTSMTVRRALNRATSESVRWVSAGVGVSCARGYADPAWPIAADDYDFAR